MIQDGKSIESEFEGTVIKDFNDLLMIERNEKDKKMNELLTRVYD